MESRGGGGEGLTESLHLPGYIRDVVSGFIGSFESFFKIFFLFRRRFKFDFRYKFHKVMKPYFQLFDKWGHQCKLI